MVGTTKRYYVNTTDELSKSCIVLRSAPNGPAIWTKERRLEQSEIVGMLQDRNGALSWTIRRPIRGWYLHIVHVQAKNKQPMASLRPPRGAGSCDFDSLVFEIRTRADARKRRRSPDEDGDEVILSLSSPSQQIPQHRLSYAGPSSNTSANANANTNININTTTDSSTTSVSSPTAASFSFVSHQTSSSIHSRRSSTIHPLTPAPTTTTIATASRSPETRASTTTSKLQTHPNSSDTQQQQQENSIIHYIPPHEDDTLTTSYFALEPEEKNSLLTSHVHDDENIVKTHQRRSSLMSKVFSYAPNALSLKKWLKSSTDNFVLKDPNRPHVMLARYQDQSSVLSASTTGILTLNLAELDNEYENSEGFWIAVMLAYLEYGDDKEAYQAAREG